MAEKTKVYGLILPKKKPELTKTRQAQQAFNVFGNESDEDNKPDVHVSIFSKNAGPSNVKRQAQVDIDTALLEDPSVYEYDNIYDEMQASKPKVGLKEKEESNIEKKPRYILGLLKAAEQKKKEDERRKERKVQKEREEEGEMFADKEKFVTTAYKQKMLTMQEEEEKEKREAAFEAMTDVTKQKDMSGFYRYLYRQTAGNEVTPVGGDDKNAKEERTDISEVKTEPESPPSGQKPKLPRRSSSSSKSSSGSSSSEGVDSEAEPKTKAETFKSNRPKAENNFRKRATTSSSSEGDAGRSKTKRSSNIKKRTQRSLSKSVSPERNRQQVKHHSRKRKSYSRSPSNNTRSVERPGSRERFRKDQRSQDTKINQRSGSQEKSGRSREKSRRSRSREKSKRSRSREKSRRSRSREKSRRSRSREKSRRSRDKHMKGQTSREEPRVERSRSHSAERNRKVPTPRSPSSGDSNGKAQGSRKKSADEEKKLQRSGKISDKEKALHTGDNESIGQDRSSVNGDKVGSILKTLRDKAEKTEAGNSLIPQEKFSKPDLVDPAKKVFPHHNSSQDIAEARKRYLQRKAVREGKA